MTKKLVTGLLVLVLSMLCSSAFGLGPAAQQQEPDPEAPLVQPPFYLDLDGFIYRLSADSDEDIEWLIERVAEYDESTEVSSEPGSLCETDPGANPNIPAIIYLLSLQVPAVACPGGSTLDASCVQRVYQGDIQMISWLDRDYREGVCNCWTEWMKDYPPDLDGYKSCLAGVQEIFDNHINDLLATFIDNARSLCCVSAP